jgi:hypothetical protein
MQYTTLLVVATFIAVYVGMACVFRRSRPWIPSEGGHPFQSKPARDSDDPGHLLGLALLSAFSSVHLVGAASSF